MEKTEIVARGIRFSVVKNDMEVGRAYVYILTNDLHVEPFGLLEDVYVHENYRGEGVAHQLLKEVIAAARTEKCYKLLATSRNDGTRDSVHAWYERLGFEKYGTEFRMNL